MAFVLVSSALSAYIGILFIDKKTLRTHKLPILGFLGFFLLLNAILVNRAQGFVQFVLVVGVFTLLALLLYLLSHNIAFVRSLAELVCVPFSLVLNYIKSVFSILNNILSGQVKLPKLKSSVLSKWAPYATGLLVGIPVVFILVHLFSLADPIFKAYADNFFKLFHIKISEHSD